MPMRFIRLSRMDRSAPRSASQTLRLACGVVLGSLAFASGAHAETLTVDSAIDQALQRNPRLSAAARTIAAARAGVRSAGALANPELLLVPGLTSLAGTGEELLLVQPLELNGARSARAAIAGGELKGAQAAAVHELRQLVFETRSAYLELARAREYRSVASSILSSTEEMDRIARRQVEVGSRPGIDRIQSGLEVSRACQQLERADGRVAAAAAALNTLIGRAPEEVVSDLSPLDAPETKLDRQQAQEQAVRARAEVLAAEAQKDVFKGEGRLARAQGRPDLAPQLRSGSLFHGVREAGVGLSITLPLFDHGQRRYRIEQAEEAVRAQDDRISAARSQVRLEVEQAMARLRTADAVVRQYREGVLDQSRRLLDATLSGFRSGFSTIAAVVEAQRTYRGVQTEYADALIEHALARAEFERAVGAVSASLIPDTTPRKPILSVSPAPSPGADSGK